MRQAPLGLFTLTFAALCGRAIAQDDCAGAVMVFNGPNGPYSNAGATTSAPPWPCAPGTNDVWFLYFPPAAGSLTVDTCGASFDTTLELFDGSAGCGSLVSLVCNDDSCFLQSSVTAPVTACTPYYIRVGGYFGGTGTFTLNVAGPGGPPCPGIATATPQGAGCVAQYTSFYEEFATSAAFDLASNSLTLTSTAGGYVVTLGGGVYHAVGSLSAPVTLALFDDDQVAAGTLGLVVGSNGWVATGPGNSSSYLVDVATMLTNPSSAWYSWHDMNPALVGSGTVEYEEAGLLAQITYDGVWDYGGSSVADANNIQFQINTGTGTVVICWGSMSTLGASGIGHLVGYSPGGASADPGGTNLSALGVLLTSTSDNLPLTLAGNGRPVQGPAASAYTVTTGNIPPSALLHVGIVGLARPGAPLAFIGMPGCFLNASLDVLVGPVLLPPSSVTWTALTLPALPPSFVGFEFNAQGAIMGTALNGAFGLGALTSNGMKMIVGTN